MNKKILVFGKGYIGKKIYQFLKCDITEKKIEKYIDIQEEIDKYQPKIIINAIGFTGYPNVDDCENHFDATIKANTFIPILFVEVAFRNKIKLIHLSSGCIYHFDHNKQSPLYERDTPNFYDLFYSRTKIYTEAVINSLGNSVNILTLRIRIPLDNQPNPKNVLDKLIRYKKIIDIPNSITYIPDFLQALKHLIKINARGVFNVVNKGGLRYPVLMEIYQKYNPNYQYEIVPLEKVLKTPRTNLLLSTRKLENTGFKVRKINDLLNECVKKYIEY